MYLSFECGIEQGIGRHLAVDFAWNSEDSGRISVSLKSSNGLLWYDDICNSSWWREAAATTDTSRSPEPHRMWTIPQGCRPESACPLSRTG